jgi:pyruvate ferredoxin oxidoreductase beta subunit
MPYERIKFYQTGSFAAGNRLLPADLRSEQSSAARANALTCGHRACQGCGEALGARYALDAVMRATKGKLIAVNATGCLEVFSTPFPETSWQIAWLHSLFGNAPAVASGVAAALKATGRSDIRVVAQGGDGGTVDIGMACLSGMFERNDDVFYICYDNQAYMNTGVQRSGATPPAARTATTPAVGPEPGNTFGQGKNVPLIAMAHEIPYVATATVADLRDLEYKATRAMDFHGARYLHILVPCPLGWGSSPADTVKVARLATESGLFPVFEAEAGEVTSSAKIRHQVPVTRLPAAPGPLRAPRAAASAPPNAPAARSPWSRKKPDPRIFLSGRADAAAGDAGRDDPDEQFPGSRCPGLDARPADRVFLGPGDMMGRPLDEDAPAQLGGRVDVVDLERHLVVGAVDAGPQVLVERAVRRGAEHDRPVLQRVVHRQHGRPEPAGIGDPADPAPGYQVQALILVKLFDHALSHRGGSFQAS